MARNDRRGAHRYKPARDQFHLGWWARGQFRSVPARLLDLSVSGALLAIDDEDARPEPGRILISPCTDGQGYWIEAELLQIARKEEGPWLVRLRLLEPFPYESFKSVVWGDNPACPHAEHSAAGDAPTGNHSQASDASPPFPPPPLPGRLAGVLGPSSVAGPNSIGLVRELRASLPVLVETHRKNLPKLDRVEPIPWLTIAFFSALAVLLVVVAACGQLDVIRRLGLMLDLAR